MRENYFHTLATDLYACEARHWLSHKDYQTTNINTALDDNRVYQQPFLYELVLANVSGLIEAHNGTTANHGRTSPWDTTSCHVIINSSLKVSSALITH